MYVAAVFAVLPALSVAVQPTVWLPTLLVATAAQLWDATPDRASLAFGLAVALPLSRTGFGETPGVRLGGVRSILRLWVADAGLPALSVQVPVPNWLAPSALMVAPTVGETGPERPSVQLQVTVTGRLFQPLALAAGVRLVRAIVGAVLSTLRFPTVVLALFPAASVAVPVADWPVPSVLSAIGAAQLAMPDPGVPLLAFLGSAQVKEMLTALLFQPLALGAGKTLPVIVGAVSSMFSTSASVAVLPALSTAVPK